MASGKQHDSHYLGSTCTPLTTVLYNYGLVHGKYNPCCVGPVGDHRRFTYRYRMYRTCSTTVHSFDTTGHTTVCKSTTTGNSSKVQRLKDQKCKFLCIVSNCARR